MLSSVVVQKSDIKFILQDDLINHDWVWKVLVYGNTLDFQLINRLHSKQNIKSCIDKNNLLDSTGIIVGSGGSDATKYFEYDFLDVNKKMLNRYYIDENDVEKWNISYVFRPRREEIFNPPYVLFKSSTNNDYQCVATYSEKQWVYRNNVMSIKGEYNDEKVLKSILAFLNSKLFTYWSFLMFSSVGIEREQILLDEIKTMPVIVNDELVEYVDEILNNVGNDKINIIQKKIDDLIFNLLSFNALERDLIDYFFEVTIPYFKRKNIKYEVNEDDLEEYINIFINYFKPYFKEENNEFFHVECFMSNQFIGINFIIDDKKPNKLIEYNTETDILDFFGNISIEDKNDLFIQKDIKGFEETSFYVIKSNEFKNWHKAVARRDLIEFINSLMGVED